MLPLLACNKSTNVQSNMSNGLWPIKLSSDHWMSNYTYIKVKAKVKGNLFRFEFMQLLYLKSALKEVLQNTL